MKHNSKVTGRREGEQGIVKSHTSLTRKTLTVMSLRVAGVVLVSAVVSFFYVVSKQETQTKQSLQKYMIERGQRESSTFQLAQDNLLFFRDQFVRELEQPASRNVDAEFKRLYLPWNDGTWRNFPQDRPIKEFDTTRFPSAVIGRNVTLTKELKQRLLIGYQLLSAYGPAWSNRFIDIYFTTPENTDTNYWRGTPRNLEVQPTIYAPNEEYFYVGDPKHSPDRKPAWTGLYLDTAVNIWMVSAIVPIYHKERFLGIVGHDIVLTNLMEHTIYDQLPGTYNLIFRADGRLIAHPKRIQELQQAQGQLKITDIKDPHLQRVFQLVTQSGLETGVIDNSQDREYLGVTRLKGPGWYFVTVYPKTLLSQTAFETATFVFLAGVTALLIELLLLYFVLQRQVAQPLHELIVATDQLADGNFAIALDTNREDEIGWLAHSFTRMATQLQQSFELMEQHNEDLEGKVQQRTQELSITIQQLKETQLQMVQSEKMSSLGQLVAGVAHEINNPVSFIHGNLNHINQYTQDMVRLLKLYQQHFPQPPQAIQDELDEIEFDFLIADLSKILQSMRTGSDRIREIILSLRNFSRLDEAEYKEADIHEGIDSTLLILQHRFKANPERPEIQIVKEYGKLPLVECYPGQLNQALMNLLANAIDALEEKQWKQQKAIASNSSTPCIWLTTNCLNDNWVAISIADNGKGMNETVRSQLFNPFFTTKPVGKGTGLGLSISYQIVAERHGGKLWCDSTPGDGTKFVIEIPIKQPA